MTLDDAWEHEDSEEAKANRALRWKWKVDRVPLVTMMLLSSVSSTFALYYTWARIICAFCTWILFFSHAGSSCFLEKNSIVDIGNQEPFSDIREKEEDCKTEVVMFALRILSCATSQLQELDNMPAVVASSVSSILRDVLDTLTEARKSCGADLNVEVDAQLNSIVRSLLTEPDGLCINILTGQDGERSRVSTRSNSLVSGPSKNQRVSSDSDIGNARKQYQMQVLARENMQGNEHYHGDGAGKGEYAVVQMLLAQMHSNSRLTGITQDQSMLPLILSLTGLLRKKMQDSSLFSFIFDVLHQPTPVRHTQEYPRCNSPEAFVGDSKTVTEEAAWGRYYLRKQKQTPGKYGNFVRDLRKPIVGVNDSKKTRVSLPPRQMESERNRRSMFMSRRGPTMRSRTSLPEFQRDSRLSCTSNMGSIARRSEAVTTVAKEAAFETLNDTIRQMALLAQYELQSPKTDQIAAASTIIE